jgi:hypothetical protein
MTRKLDTFPRPPSARAPRYEALAQLQTDLALARWRAGGSQPDGAAGDPAGRGARARWYAQLEQQLTTWLGEGGMGRPTVSLEKTPQAVRILTE